MRRMLDGGRKVCSVIHFQRIWGGFLEKIGFGEHASSDGEHYEPKEESEVSQCQEETDGALKWN